MITIPRTLVRRLYVEHRTAATGDPQAIEIRIQAPVLPFDARCSAELFDESYAAVRQNRGARFDAVLMRLASYLVGERGERAAGKEESEGYT